MTERFTTNKYYIYDRFKDGEKWLVNEVEVYDIVKTMNNLDCKARERSKALSKLQKENDRLVKENKEILQQQGKVELENERLKQELKEFKDYVFSDEKILCYSCVYCVSKGIYEVECSEKGKVDVHGSCFLYWKKECK